MSRALRDLAVRYLHADGVVELDNAMCLVSTATGVKRKHKAGANNCSYSINIARWCPIHPERINILREELARHLQAEQDDVLVVDKRYQLPPQMDFTYLLR